MCVMAVLAGAVHWFVGSLARVSYGCVPPATILADPSAGSGIGNPFSDAVNKGRRHASGCFSEVVRKPSRGWRDARRGA